jgi:hypothetical protein
MHDQTFDTFLTSHSLAEADEVNEAGEDSWAWKSLLRTPLSSRFLNSMVWGLKLLYFVVLKKKLTESWKLMLNFSTFSVGGCWGCMRSKSLKLLVRHKCPILRNPLNISFWKICQTLWSRQVFTLYQILMVDPVQNIWHFSFQSICRG